MSKEIEEIGLAILMGRVPVSRLGRDLLKDTIHRNFQSPAMRKELHVGDRFYIDSIREHYVFEVKYIEPKDATIFVPFKTRIKFVVD